jgi:uncharacterized protein (TIGR02246 family)
LIVDEREQPIAQVMEAYKAAVFAKDVDAFVGLYDQGVRVFDMWGVWSYSGVAAWREMVADWFGSLGSERVVVAMNDVQIIVAPDLAVAHAFVTYTGQSAEGKALRAMQNRMTWALKQQDGGWKIVHEHTSAPVDFETSKVLLQR